MDFLNYWSAIRARLDEEVVYRVPRFFRNLPAEQIEAVQQVVADGKRIRGCLVYLMSNALGGRTEDAIPRAVAIECIHAASLILREPLWILPIPCSSSGSSCTY